MSTQLIDLSQHPLALRLRRVGQMRRHVYEPLIDNDFAAELQAPMMTASERAASTERLICVRQRALESDSNDVE